MAANESIIRIRGDASQAVTEFQKLRAATVQSYQAIEKTAESFKELRDNQRSMAQVSKIATDAIKKLSTATGKNKLAKNLNDAEKATRKFSAGLERLKKDFGSASMRAHQFSRDLKSVGLAVRNSGKNLQFMGRSIMIGMLPFANAIRKASNFAKALEMAEIRFIKITQVATGAGSKFEELAAAFEKISVSFGVSRDLITDIATDFALVGLPISEVETLARATNELAILGSIDVGPAKDILISTVFAMRNMATLRGETLSFNDAITQATGQMYLFNIVNNNTAMAIKDMATAIPKLVPITVQFGLTITEAAGALAAMKASGVSAAEGTVALRTGLLRLTSLTKQADEKVEGARLRLKEFNFEAGVGIETLANFGQSLLAIRTELGDAAAFDIVKNILGIRQTAKVQLFVMDMQSAENQISVVKKAMKSLGGTDVFGQLQIKNMTDFAKASREPSQAMKDAAHDLLADATQMEDVTSQFLRSLIIQMSGVENAASDSMTELNTVLESDAFKMNQAKTSMKNALTDLGGLINMMIVDHILPLVTHWINAFKSMPDGVKKIIVVLAALVASFGPILYMLAIMKMAFGQTLQIVAGAVGKFFAGFTAAGRAAIVAANQEAISVEILAVAHETAAIAAAKHSVAAAQLAGTLSASQGVAFTNINALKIEAVSHSLDAKAAQQSAAAHRTASLTRLIQKPLPVLGGSIKGMGQMAGRGAKRVGRGLFGARGVAGAIINPVGAVKRAGAQVGRFAHGVRGKAMPFGRMGRLGAGVRSPFAQFAAGRRGGYTAARGLSGQFQAHTPISMMGAGRVGAGVKGLGGKALAPVKKGLGAAAGAGKKMASSLTRIPSILGKMLRPIKMIKMIFMSFNPWILGFMLLLGAAAAIFVTIKKNWETFRAAAQPGLDALKEAWLSIKAALGEVMNSVFQVFNRLSFGGKKGADEGTQMGNVFSAVFKGIAGALKVVAVLFQLLAKIIATAMDFATPYINYLLGALTGMIEVVKMIAALVRGDFPGAWEHAKRAVGAIILGFISMVDGLFSFIKDQIAKVMNIAADALDVLGKVPGMGKFKDLAEGVRDAASAMQDFGDNAIDGIRRGIEGATGIKADEMIHIGDEDVRNVGKELGKILGEGTNEGFDEALGFGDPGQFEAVNDQAKEAETAAGAFADAWTSAFGKFAAEVKKQIRKHMSAAIKFITDAFDAQTDSVTSAYDAQIDAINEVIKEEQRLSKEIAYQTKRREQIRDMALRRDSYRRNRALAIYEGRIDDARSLDLKEKKNKEDSDQKLTDLDTKHGETLLSQQRKDTMDQINEQKRAYQDLRSDMKDELNGVLAELTRFTPKNKEEWMQIVDDIDAEVTKIVGDEESAGIMGRFAGSYHPDMPDIETFDYAGGFDTAVENATEILRNKYIWDPATMEVDGPFDWLFTAFAAVEEEFMAFETKIKTWKDRIKAAILGDQPDPHATAQQLSANQYVGMGPGPMQMMSQAVGAGTALPAHLGGTSLAAGDIISDSEIQGLEVEKMTAEYNAAALKIHLLSQAMTLSNLLIGGSLVPAASSVSPGHGTLDNPHYGSRPGEEQGNWDFLEAGRDIVDWLFGSKYSYYGGAIKAQYGRYLGGFGSSMIPVMAHGGEFMMSAKATRRIGVGALNNMNNFSKLSGPNDAGGGVTNSSSSNVTINVDTFIGQREWFEKLMSDYNIHVAPSSERARGIEKRTVGSYTERNTRSRV